MVIVNDTKKAKVGDVLRYKVPNEKYSRHYEVVGVAERGLFLVVLRTESEKAKSIWEHGERNQPRFVSHENMRGYHVV